MYIEDLGIILFCLIIFLAICAAYIFLYYKIARFFERIAFLKGYDEDIHAFAMCFWLGIIGYIYVAALPDLIMQERLKRNNMLLEQQIKNKEK